MKNHKYYAGIALVLAACSGDDNNSSKPAQDVDGNWTITGHNSYTNCDNEIDNVSFKIYIDDVNGLKVISKATGTDTKKTLELKEAVQNIDSFAGEVNSDNVTFNLVDSNNGNGNIKYSFTGEHNKSNNTICGKFAVEGLKGCTASESNSKFEVQVKP